MNWLILDPHHTGSHAHWAKGMQFHLSQLPDVHAELWTLPGRHWKWRMHGACGAFADMAYAADAPPDVILTTDMLDVAGLRGLLPASWRTTPIALYFHENQMTFPWSPGDKEKARNLHSTYAFMNIQSALAADWIWFNSAYHRRVFLDEGAAFMRQMPDHTEAYNFEAIAAKSSDLPVGIDVANDVDLARPIQGPPIILWNHRWAYDKGPDRFLAHLQFLNTKGMAFKLILCGAPSKNEPHAFSQLRELFADRILHAGFADSKAEYVRLLQAADVLLHDPVQEYFGVSVAEAMSQGVIPLVKNDQAYTSWVPEAFRFNDQDDLLAKWNALLSNVPSSRNQAHEAAIQFDWPQVTARAHRELSDRFGLN